jgi:hypothetical protein
VIILKALRKPQKNFLNQSKMGRSRMYQQQQQQEQPKKEEGPEDILRLK